MFSVAFVCLSFCFSVTNITQKLSTDGDRVYEEVRVTQGTSD